MPPPVAQPTIRRQIELYDKQFEFVECNDRFTAFVAGIGSGKSYAGAVKMFKAVTERPCLNMVTAPTYTMLQDASLRTFLDVAGESVVNFHKSKLLVTVAHQHGKSEIIFRSTENPDRLRGPSISNWWGDEIAYYDKMVYPVMIGRLREGGRAGHAWLTGTPKGRNWLWERRNEIRIFNAHTRDNPYLDREFVHSLEQSYTGQYADQELAGEFITHEGLVYEDFNRETHVVKRELQWNRIFIAGDEGYTNPAVLLIIGEDGDGRLHVFREFYQRRVLQQDFIRLSKDWCVTHTADLLIMDPSAAGLIAEMAAAGIPVTPANNDVLFGIQTVKNYFAKAGDGLPRLTIDPSCINLISELEGYCWKENKVGMKDEPVKVNDHAVDSLRYGVMAFAQGGPLFAWDPTPQSHWDDDDDYTDY